MRILYLTLAIVIVDQLTKLKVKGISIPFLGIDVKGMQYGSSSNIFGNYFKFTFIENPGMAFGLEIGGKLFLSIFTIFATILIIYFIYKNRNERFLIRFSFALILGGAVGNLIDRIFYGIIYGYAPVFYGRVVDFFHFDIPDFKLFGKTYYSWPIFNVADISVTVGFILIMIGYSKIFKKKTGSEILVPETGSFVKTDDILSNENSPSGEITAGINSELPYENDRLEKENKTEDSIR